VSAELEAPDAEPPRAEPPQQFDRYELVVLRWPEGRGEIDEETAEALQGQHLGHLEAMRRAGHLKVAGPLDEQSDEAWRGICVYQVGSLEQVRQLAGQDPAVRAGRLAIDVMSWYTPKGAVSFPASGPAGEVGSI
jgi:uncharacterized protein YciI